MEVTKKANELKDIQIKQISSEIQQLKQENTEFQNRMEQFETAKKSDEKKMSELNDLLLSAREAEVQEVKQLKSRISQITQGICDKIF